jgi:pimeloyl-ACP methyl ester carboxylesterase
MTLGSLHVSGRQVAFAEWGDPDGFPVVVMHGTPGSRHGRWSDPQALAATGVRQIGINRPGYGPSDRLDGRTVASVVPDVLAVVDALGVDRFAISGTSGGGPHALAVAALTPDRVVKCRVLSSLAPAGIPGFFDGMDAHNVEEWELVFALTTPFGWYDDDMAFAAHWGFELTEVEVPVEVRYAEHDVFVPPTHGEWLARRIPHAQVTRFDAQGHLGDASFLTDLREFVAACHRG